MAGRERPPKKAAESEPVKLRDLPVLVVDDNSTNRKILEEMIANWRMKPVAAANGPAAMEALQRAHKDGTPFRLVLLDGHMPGMDGFEVAARVKQDPQLHGAAVILLTSAGRSEDVARARRRGSGGGAEQAGEAVGIVGRDRHRVERAGAARSAGAYVRGCE